MLVDPALPGPTLPTGVNYGTAGLTPCPGACKANYVVVVPPCKTRKPSYMPLTRLSCTQQMSCRIRLLFFLRLAVAMVVVLRTERLADVVFVGNDPPAEVGSGKQRPPGHR